MHFFERDVARCDTNTRCHVAGAVCIMLYGDKPLVFIAMSCDRDELGIKIAYCFSERDGDCIHKLV